MFNTVILLSLPALLRPGIGSLADEEVVAWVFIMGVSILLLLPPDCSFRWTVCPWLDLAFEYGGSNTK